MIEPFSERAAKAASSRPRGRPADATGKDLRGDILAAAEKQFGRHGFAGATLRRIADEVGVTPAMIHYYFGSKKALFREMLDQALLPLAEAIAGLRDSRQDPLEQVPRLLTRMAAEHPHLPALVAREVFLPGGQMQQHFVEHLAPRLGGALPELLAAEQRAGRIDPAHDPRLAALLVLSMCFFPFLARPLAERALGLKYDAAGIAALESQIGLLLRQGLRS